MKKKSKKIKKQEKQKKESSDRILITAALPYANGPLHLGHMVEYIQADIYTRAMKLFGKKAVFVCADDTHGAPIEIKATSLGMKPEELIAKYDTEHTKDFADFEIAFDSYYTTNSPENKKYSDFIFEKLKQANTIYKKKVAVIYCENCNRFLPDRYVRGTCPKCKAPDQYGDVCEKCSSTHKTTDLIDPKCAICSKKPISKQSEHYFFKLRDFREKLWTFFHAAELQPEVVHFINNWLPELQDWCISRDGPYFGFKIPGEENKYYYVWLDAPIGYIASTEHYCDISGKNRITKKTTGKKEIAKETVADYWNNPQTKIIHFIGKDIVYFHFLFWPAMLMTAGFQLPKKIMVHGFLTVNKEKMSKSRGTFITARQYLDHLNPEFLRFYYAAHLSPTLADLDFDLQQFKERVNQELIANIANFCYRVLFFAEKNFSGNIGKFHEKDVADEIVALRGLFISIQNHYEKMNFKEALKDILAVSSLGNKYFQSQEPWKLIKDNSAKAQEVISFCVYIIKSLSIVIAPVLPMFSAQLQKQLGLSSLVWKDLGFEKHELRLSSVAPLFAKLEDEHEKLIVQETAEKKREKGIKKIEEKIEEKTEEKTEQKLEQKAIFPLLLKVGKIISVEDHPNADKLYVEKIDSGAGDVRTIVSGIKQWYKKEELVGKQVVVVANLKPVKLRGVMSEGMLLASHHEGQLQVVEAPKSNPGDIVFLDDDIKETKNAKDISRQKEIVYEEFEKFPISVFKKRVVCLGKKLKTEKEEIVVDMPDGSSVS